MDDNKFLSILENRLKNLEIQAEAIKQTISAIKGTRDFFETLGTVIEAQQGDTPKQFSDGYDTKWSLKKKVAHAFKVKDRFLHIREICDFLAERELTNNRSEEDYHILLTQIRGVLGRLRREETLVRFSVDGQLRNSVWGSPRWLNEGGDDILSDHYYDKSVLYQDESEEIDI